LFSYSYSGRGKLGKTADRTSSWRSDTSIKCVASSGISQSGVLIFSLGCILQSLSKSFSYDSNNILAVSMPNSATTGGGTLTSSGIDFGPYRYNFYFSNYESIYSLQIFSGSIKVRLGGTPSSSTTWISYTSATCKVGAGAFQSLPITATIGSRVCSETSTVSYDAVSVTSVSGVNGPVSSLTGMIIAGKNKGTIQFSGKGRVGVTQTQSSVWLSDTALQCSSSSGVAKGLQVSVTVGGAVGSLLASFSYDLPLILSSTGESRALTGSWCAFGNSSTCYCQGIVSSVPSNGVLGANVVDSSVSVSCTSGVSGNCYCFNLPFTGGQHLTVAGQDFGLADYTPAISAPSTSAQLTKWISQSSIVCVLPTCTNCGVSSTSQSLFLVVAGQSSISTSITVPYTYSTSRRRRTSTNDLIDIGYEFNVPESARCPYFWLHSGLHTLDMGSGAICRKDYQAGDDVQWIIDPCSSSSTDSSCDVFQIDHDSVSLVTVTLVIKEFNVGNQDRFVLSSCTDRTCSQQWIKADSSVESELAGMRVVGSPYVLISWKSFLDGDTAAGWDINWALSPERTYRRFSRPVTHAEARTLCGNLAENGGGWQLASISSPREQSAVLQLAGNQDVWIGLVLPSDYPRGSKQHSELLRDHSWLDGSLFLPEPFRFWKVDNSVDDTGCVVLEGSSGIGRWKSEPCQSERAFVCSKS
jgi:hypothetical protein